MEPFASPGQFVEPPWDAPLDVPAILAAIPPDTTIAGMFFLAVAEGAKRRGVALAQPRERYLPFGFYPVVEFAPLLVAASQVFYPERTLRQGLRAIGTVAPQVFVGSVLGKVTLGAAEGVHAVVTAMASTYSINIRPCSCTIRESSPNSMIVSLTEVQHFLDSHHVGVFEGTLQHAGVKGRVRIHARSRISADFLLEWS